MKHPRLPQLQSLDRPFKRLLSAGCELFFSAGHKRPAAGIVQHWPSLLLCLLAVGFCGTASATSLYWDSNGTTAGAGAAPAGTWGTDSFWNSDPTGGAGSFTATTTSTDDLFFSAGNTTALSGTSAYNVAVNGTQSANKLTFQSIGAATLSGGTINLGSGGIFTQRTVVTANDRQVATISSNIALTANQAWVSDGTNATNSLLITGAVSGTGNLTLTQNANRVFSLSNSVNHVGSITVTGNNTAGVTISGDIGSSVTSISLTSNVPLNLSGTNSYSGATTVTAPNSNTARLRAASNNSLAAGTTVTLNATQNSSSAILDLGSGTGSFNPTVAGLATGVSRLTSSIITNSDTTAGFAHTGTLTVDSSGAAVPADSTFGGLIQDGTTSRVALTKAGSRTLTLTGANTYTGATTVNAGTLVIGVAGVGSLTSAINVNAGTLSGSGSTTGAVLIGNGAGGSDSFIAPGNSPGTFTTTGSLSLAADATYQFELNSGTLLADKIVANGLSLNSSSVFSFSDLASSAIAMNTIFVAIDNTSGSAISGFFSGLAEGATFTSGLNQYRASYVGGVGSNDFTLTVVPEPSTWLLFAGSGTFFVVMRRRRQL